VQEGSSSLLAAGGIFVSFWLYFHWIVLHLGRFLSFLMEMELHCVLDMKIYKNSKSLKEILKFHRYLYKILLYKKRRQL